VFGSLEDAMSKKVMVIDLTGSAPVAAVPVAELVVELVKNGLYELARLVADKANAALVAA
jgi:hypothetical protein